MKTETFLYILVTVVLSLTPIFTSYQLIAYFSKYDKSQTALNFFLSKKVKLVGSIFYGGVSSLITLFIEKGVTGRSLVILVIVFLIVSGSWYFGTSLGNYLFSKRNGGKG